MVGSCSDHGRVDSALFMACEVWGVKNGHYEVWSVKAVRSEKCKVRTVKCELWSMKFGVRRVQL